jgi:hypothetical protein
MTLESDARGILGGAFVGVTFASGYQVREMTADDVLQQYDEMQIARGARFYLGGGSDRAWTPGDGRLRFKDLFGFTDRQRRAVVVLSGAPVSTLVHEMLHASADPTFPDQLGPDLDEGATALLTSYALAKAGQNPDASYAAQRDIVDALTTLVGQKTLEDAYFRGNLAQLRATTDDLVGPNAFDSFVRRLTSGEGMDFAMAKLLPGRKDGAWTATKIRAIQGYLNSYLCLSADEWERIRLIIHSASDVELQKIRDAIAPLITGVADLGDRTRLRLWLVSGGST